MVRQYLHLFQANVVVANIRVLAHNALNSTEICGKKCILLKFSLSLSRLWLILILSSWEMDLKGGISLDFPCHSCAPSAETFFLARPILGSPLSLLTVNIVKTAFTDNLNNGIESGCCKSSKVNIFTV